jgi:hypothetical protein
LTLSDTPGSQVLARMSLLGLTLTALGERLGTQWLSQRDIPFLSVGFGGQSMQCQMRIRQELLPLSAFQADHLRTL